MPIVGESASLKGLSRNDVSSSFLLVGTWRWHSSTTVTTSITNRKAFSATDFLRLGAGQLPSKTPSESSRQFMTVFLPALWKHQDRKLPGWNTVGIHIVSLDRLNSGQNNLVVISLTGVLSQRNRRFSYINCCQKCLWDKRIPDSTCSSKSGNSRGMG